MKKSPPVSQRIADVLGMIPNDVRKYHVQSLLRRLGTAPGKRTKSDLLQIAEKLLKHKHNGVGNATSKVFRQNGEGINRVQTLPIPKNGKIVIIQKCAYPAHNGRSTNTTNKTPRPTKTTSPIRPSPTRMGPPPPPPPPPPPMRPPVAPRPPPPPKPQTAPRKQTQVGRSARNDLMHSLKERFRTNNKLKKKFNQEEVHEAIA